MHLVGWGVFTDTPKFIFCYLSKFLNAYEIEGWVEISPSQVLNIFL